MNAWRKRLEGDGPVISPFLKRSKLREIAKPVPGVHKDPVLVFHLAGGERLIYDARYMHDPRPLRKKSALHRKEMVKGVMDDAKVVFATDGFNGLDGFGFVPQRRPRESERLDKCGHLGFGQHGSDFFQGEA